MKAFKNLVINTACVRSFLKERPIFAAWHVTYRCNLRCKFCNFWKRDIDRRGEYSVEDFQKSVPKLLKMGVRVVNFAGGEPCIRKDLPEIVTKFADDFIVIINTNGMHITDAYATALWEAGTDIVNVSLDFSRRRNIIIIGFSVSLRQSGRCDEILNKKNPKRATCRNAGDFKSGKYK